MELKAEQLDQLAQTLSKHLGYLFSLRERMDRRGWSPLDKLRVQVEAAYNAMHSLTVETRYRAIEAAKKERG